MGPTHDLVLSAGSRAVRRSLGAVSWALLEELALGAEPDGDGVVVATTNVRGLAAGVGLNKDTVARGLTRLIAAGIVVRRPQRFGAGFGPAVYELRLPEGLSVAVRPTSSDTRATARSERRRPAGGGAAGQLSLLGDESQTATPNRQRDTTARATTTGTDNHPNRTTR